jgi:D-glycero-beta-D-manno-heptose 1-phosphate adenylyltransferase
MLEIKNKIKNIEEAVLWKTQLRENNLRLVFTNGCFDILHRGHIEYLYQTKAYGDKLIVALNSDASVKTLKGIGRPINNEYDRAFLLASMFFIDAVVIFDSIRCDNIIKQLKPDIYVKGGDYNIDNLDISEKDALLEANCEIKFVPMINGYSTTSILGKK